MADNGVLSEVSWRFSAGSVPADAWVVTHVHARESMSELMTCTVVLAMEPDGGGLEGLLGAPAHLDMHRAGLTRAFQGVVQGVEEIGTLASHRFVRLDVVPSLWLLSQRSDNRIFQEQNVIQIIRKVLSDAGVYQGSGKLAVDGSLEAIAPREYCVQYHETDLDFVRRLLEQEGIPFYFRHDGEGGETLVLAGDDHAWQPIPTATGGALHIADEGAALDATESIKWFDERHQIRSTGTTTRDFDFTRPRATLDMTGRSPGNLGRLARYEYPSPSTITNYDQGAKSYKTHDTPRLAKVRTEEQQTRAHVGGGRGNVVGVMPGRTFELSGHARPDLDRAYLVTASEHVGQAWSVLPENLRHSRRVRDMLLEAGLTLGDSDALDDRYRNRFHTHRVKQDLASVPFRPARQTPRPVVEGPQTARVVGPAGEDIHCDEHGRVKVQFHWDREGKENENSSCWIRVAQTMGGGNWGFVFIPRIGMEAVVSFLEGDPDRPLVTGCVYNGENQPPYPLPESKTKTSLKTWSTPKTGGFNEMRFEDAAGKEQMYIQAERDQDTLVKHDRTLDILRHCTRTIGGDEHNTVKQNRVSRVNENDSLTIDGNHDTEVHGPQGATLSVDKDLATTVGANETRTVQQNQAVTVMQNQAVTVMMAAAETVGLVKAVTVGMQFVLTVGKSSLTMDAAGNISLKGKKIEITADGPVAVNGSIIDLN